MDLLLAARFMQGVAAGGTRVLVVAIVRDRYPRLGDGADHVAGDDHLHDRAGARARPSARSCSLSQAGGTSSSRSRSTASAWRCGAGSGCPRRSPSRTGGRSPPRISAARWRRRCGTRASIGNTVASTLAFGAPVRVHRLDPADRVRRVRPARADRPRLRLHRRADGGDLLRQFAAGDAARRAAAADRGADRASPSSRWSTSSSS